MMIGEEFLHLERELRKIPGEAAARTRIGRLYYGVYLEYRTFCENFLSFDRRKLAREHQAVRNLIVPIDAAAADILPNLRVARNRADDDLDINAETVNVLLAESVTAAQLAVTRLAKLRFIYERR